MKYDNCIQGVFISRPNRFIANIEINGKREICHVKNTGRCRELLVPGAKVIVQKMNKPGRKTKYDLISVYKGNRLVNIDSQAPNKVFQEYLHNNFENISLIKPETKYKNSRFDFYIEAGKEKIFVEVKGVTLEKDNIALFPDAPTIRGVKHLEHLAEAVQEGYRSMVAFVIQMEGVSTFRPNWETHKQFAETLRNVSTNNVEVIAFDCIVTQSTIVANKSVRVDLSR